MPKFLTTRGAGHYIENIIIDAKKELTLVSPYLKIPKVLYDRIKEAIDRKVSVTIIYGKDELKSSERGELKNLKNIKLYFCKDLHAKCYFNEQEMVITSMNMYEYSEQHNREMGVHINCVADKELYQQALAEVKSILSASEFVRDYKIKFTSSIETIGKYLKNSKGFCIRCERSIPYNPDKPYCEECYKTWSQFSNPDYVENVCHRCGKEEITSMNKPQHYKCYLEWQNGNK